jgi:hypothetical protein
VGEERVVSLKDGLWNETFDRYAARAYRVALPEGAGQLAVSAIATALPSPPSGAKLAAESACTNLLPNSSFEIDDPILPGVPKGWWKPFTFGGWKWPMVGEKGSPWGPDDANAWHGKRSLCMRLAPEETTHKYRVVAQYMPRLSVQAGKTYTLSLYAKADTPGIALRMFVIDAGWGNTQWADVTLGTEWRRYSLTRAWPPGLSGKVWVRADVMSAGTAWIDAMQFEEGGAASPYRPRE